MKVFDIWLMDSLQQENKMRNAIQYLWLKQTARSTENRVSSNRAERVTGRNSRKTRTKIFYRLRISFTSKFFFPISFSNSNILDRHQIFKYNFKNVRHNWNTDLNVIQYKIKFGYYITRKHRDKVYVLIVMSLIAPPNNTWCILSFLWRCHKLPLSKPLFLELYADIILKANSLVVWIVGCFPTLPSYMALCPSPNSYPSSCAVVAFSK